MALKADKNRDSRLYIYGPAVLKKWLVFIVLFNCIKNWCPQQCRSRNKRRMKNVSVLVNFNCQRDGACDPRCPCVPIGIANLNFSYKVLFCSFSRNLRVARLRRRDKRFLCWRNLARCEKREEK